MKKKKEKISRIMLISVAVIINIILIALVLVSIGDALSSAKIQGNSENAPSYQTEESEEMPEPMDEKEYWEKYENEI